MGLRPPLGRFIARRADATAARRAVQDDQRRNSRSIRFRCDSAKQPIVKSEFKDHFSDRAARYAAYRPHYPPAVADFVARIAPAREVAWDVGCGSGQFSTLLGDRFGRVIATDASADQLALARPHPHVEYMIGRAEAAPIAGGAVDLIVAAQA